MEMQALVEQFIPVTIMMLEREFPNGILHTLTSHEDVASPASYIRLLWLL